MSGFMRCAVTPVNVARVSLVLLLIFISSSQAQKVWQPDKQLVDELLALPENNIRTFMKNNVSSDEKIDYAVFIAGELIFKRREYKKAQAYISIAEYDLKRRTNDYRNKAKVHVLRMTLDMYDRRYDDVVLNGNKAIDYMQKYGEHTQNRFVYILSMIADAHYTNGDYSKSLDASLRIINEYSNGDSRHRADALFSAAESYYKLSDYQKGVAAADNAFRIYENTGRTKGLGHASKVLGNLYKSMGEIEKSRQSYTQALGYYREVRDHHGTANCLYNLGNINRKEKEYGVSIMNYEDAAYHYVKSGSVSGLGMAKMEIGKVQELMGDYEKSAEIYDEAKMLLVKSNSQARLAQLEYYYASLHLKRGQSREARNAYLRALKIYRKADNQRMVEWVEKQLNKMQKKSDKVTP